jgi:hypothetical protein
MNENEILGLGFKKNEWTYEGEDFVEYIKGNGAVGIEISGINLVELTVGKSVFITVPNCDTIEKLKQLLSLFNI